MKLLGSVASRHTSGDTAAGAPGLSDLAGLFRVRGMRGGIADASARLHERFPQVGCSIVTTTLEPLQPLTAYAFWLFNRGGICRELHRGNKSRELLLTLDAANARASLMIGYGLEPFVGRGALQDMINAGAPHFAREHWVDGIVAVLDATTQRLAEILAKLGQTTVGYERRCRRRRRREEVKWPRPRRKKARGLLRGEEQPNPQLRSAVIEESLRFASARGVAQPGRAPALGAGGRRFESGHPDHIEKQFVMGIDSFHHRRYPTRSLTSKNEDKP